MHFIKTSTYDMERGFSFLPGEKLLACFWFISKGKKKPLVFYGVKYL